MYYYDLSICLSMYLMLRVLSSFVGFLDIPVSQNGFVCVVFVCATFLCLFKLWREEESAVACSYAQSTDKGQL